MTKNNLLHFFVCFLLLLTACTSTPTITDYKKGSFKTFLDNKRDSSTFVRIKNLQIEKYKGIIDTFEIEWKNNFEFHLHKTHPKSHLDSIPFVVKITKLMEDSYEFQANYLNSNFKQKGTTYKLN